MVEVQDQGVRRLVYSEASLVGLQMANVHVCVTPWCLFLIYEDTSHIGVDPLHLMTSFSFNYLLERPISKYNHILRYWGLGIQHRNLRGTQFHSSCLYKICLVHNKQKEKKSKPYCFQILRFIYYCSLSENKKSQYLCLIHPKL